MICFHILWTKITAEFYQTNFQLYTTQQDLIKSFKQTLKKKSKLHTLTQQFGNTLLPGNALLGCSYRDYIIDTTIFSYSVTPVTKENLGLNATDSKLCHQRARRYAHTPSRKKKNDRHHTFFKRILAGYTWQLKQPNLTYIHNRIKMMFAKIKNSVTGFILIVTP